MSPFSLTGKRALLGRWHRLLFGACLLHAAGIVESQSISDRSIADAIEAQVDSITQPGAAHIRSHRCKLSRVIVPWIEPVIAAVPKRSMQIIDDARAIPRRAKVPLGIELMNQLRPGNTEAPHLRGSGLRDDVYLRFDRVGDGPIGDTLRLYDAGCMQQTGAKQKPGPTSEQGPLARL